MTRRLTLGLSVGFHATLILIGVLHAFWHVEELEAPRIPLMLYAPPPPPKGLAAPPGGGGPREPVKPATGPTRPPRALTQPAEKPPEERPAVTEPTTSAPAAASTSTAGESGTGPGKGPGAGPGMGDVDGPGGPGVPGSVDGEAPVPPAPPSPRLLPPSIAAQQLLSTERPHLPAALAKMGARYAVLAKICVAADGNVASVHVLKSDDPLLDAGVVAVCSHWRYRPWEVNGHAVPFCYATRLAFETE